RPYAERMGRMLGSLAQSLGISQEDVSSKLAGLLPDVVDKLTPNGQMPDAGALGELLGSLKGRIG
ncbi:MAG TPA: YidB family protein, partial [Usitatibacteraceae bacterium]|nr:YidB family protein [Usitatibacteraceae bacterium]